MSNTPSPELLTEAAGVKIFMTPLLDDFTGKINITLENLKSTKIPGKSCGFHLTKSKWDPYPWVSHVEVGSRADIAGLRAGDCLITIDEKDLIGLKIKQIATLIHDKEHEQDIKLSLWRYPDEKEEPKEIGLALKGPLPDVASRLVNAISAAVRVLECPVCLDSSIPPVSQCVHGHIICVRCRSRTSRCPVCRVRLGQGRCLLADKLHKILRDIFNIRDESCKNMECETWSLRERLFGGNKKKRVSAGGMKNNNVIPKARQLLLTKLFLGGLEKAASADNLTVSKIDNESPTANGTPISNVNFSERLNLYDRTKSASTGELSKEIKRESIDDSMQSDATNSVASSTASLASTSHSPIWGGSMDSMSCMQIMCPLSKKSGCKDIVTSRMLLEHLKSHEVPQVHFYSANIEIPIPLPFGPDAAYILHHAGDIFFFQYEAEAVWMTCATGGNTWEWTLHGQGKDGTEIRVRRIVASLEDSLTLTSQHIMPLPSALLLHTLSIRILACRLHEKLNV